MKSPYEGIKRGCQYLHGFGKNDISFFLGLAGLRDGMVVLDAMCGEGALSQQLSKKNIELHLLDNSGFQIGRAKENVKGAEFHIGSVLEMPFSDGTFDAVFIRNGVYEVSKRSQIKLYKEVLRVLKKGGLFLSWTLGLDEAQRDFVQAFVGKKDKLAGFDDLVRNRHLMTRSELSSDLKAAGFSNVGFPQNSIEYVLSTQKWGKTDFLGDKKKVSSLNEYVLGLKKPASLSLEEHGGDVRLVVSALLSVSQK